MRPLLKTIKLPAAVRCRNLFRSFGEDKTRSIAINGVDLDIPAGKVTFVVGPSGCGKTTLLSIIAGILSPEKGEISVFGTNISSLSRARATRFRAYKIGIVTQQFNLLPSLTVVENATVPLLVQRIRAPETIKRAKTLLEELGLGDHLEKYPCEISTGQQQRTAIARALIHEPRLVICDEPTAALDGQSGSTVMRLLRHVALRPERAVVVVTHDHRILDQADRIARMNDGRITAVEEVESREAG